ncbi:DUF6901 family protein [candidate division CSSED10-310 bacterium]|uniref:DUF6901 family protein n=1 Tax=candidate division CSSED10-310 bacterium TaxID=2855610 RepID=A0ABV6Z6J8_UNCC1
MNKKTIQYNFKLNDLHEIFDIELDEENLNFLGADHDAPPSWTRLDYNQCPNCPLTLETHPYCPLAVNLINLVTRFERLISYDEIELTVVTEERIIMQTTTAQRGISSLMGLLIATSGCPHTFFFKPMARFHLPFASIEETVTRTTSMYLLAQYFINNEGGEPDLELKGLLEIYQNIQTVNQHIAHRLREVTEKDSVVNAIILLDTYAQYLPDLIERSLKRFRFLFKPFLSHQQER